MSILIPRQVRHHGATGKTLLPTLVVGTRVNLHEYPGAAAEILQVRKKRKYPKRYLIEVSSGVGEYGWWWARRDQFDVVAS